MATFHDSLRSSPVPHERLGSLCHSGHAGGSVREQQVLGGSNLPAPKDAELCRKL